MTSRYTELKQKQVKNLAEQIKKAKTFMIVSIKSLPSKQFQDIKKSIRGSAEVKVAKKNIMLRAIKEVGKDSILGLEKYIKENSAFAISDLEGYELAGILSKKKTPVFAKAGQIAPEDIEVKAGSTDLVPGPAISELGSLGLQVAVESGKISIKVSRVIVDKGRAINENAASILQKLNIQPFSVGLEPVVIYDVETEKIYTDIKIDSEETTEKLRIASAKALGFAQKIVYYCKETIGYLLGKANSENKKLSEFVKEDVSEEKEKESKAEEDNTTQEKTEEVRVSENSSSQNSDNSNSEDKPDTKGKKENTQLNNQEEKP